MKYLTVILGLALIVVLTCNATAMLIERTEAGKMPANKVEIEKGALTKNPQKPIIEKIVPPEPVPPEKVVLEQILPMLASALDEVAYTKVKNMIYKGTPVSGFELSCDQKGVVTLSIDFGKPDKFTGLPFRRLVITANTKAEPEVREVQTLQEAWKMFQSLASDGLNADLINPSIKIK